MTGIALTHMIAGELGSCQSAFRTCQLHVLHAKSCQRGLYLSGFQWDKTNRESNFHRKSSKPELMYTPSFAPIAEPSAAIVGTRSTLKARLKDGETLYGMFLMSFSPILAEIAGLAGYDFVVIDMEHGYGDISQALPCLHALASTKTPAILRLPESTPTWAKKALDLGPDGLMFPMIHDADSARKAVSYCRYPPAGIRGVAHPVIRASKYGLDDNYIINCEQDLFIMCQVESEEAARKAGVICAVDGVDSVMMGPLDLSASLGYLWDPGNTKVNEVLKEAEEAVLGRIKRKGSGAYLAGFAMPHDGPLELKSRGYHMVCGAVDLALFRSAALDDVRSFKTIE